jgi:hypothetical protein
MTTLREASQLALKALEGGGDSWRFSGPAIDALKAALEQTEPLVSMSEMNRTVAYCAASKLRELGYDWDGKIWASLEQPERAQRMRDAGYIRRPTLREMAALEQSEQEQEPGWRLSCGCPSQYGGIPAEWPDTDREGSPAVAYGVICERHWHEYEANPPRREWRELSDQEIEDCWYGYLSDYQLQMIRAIEAKLKELNHE